MKRLLLLYILLCISISSYCDTTDKDYTLVYICRDRSTSPTALSRKLRDYYDIATKGDNICIFYLADENQPFIVQVNTADDNRGDFFRLIDEIQERSHSAKPLSDVDDLLELIARNDFLDEEKKLIYRQVSIEFYVSPLFFRMGSHEKLIVPLYCALNVPELSKQAFDFWPCMQKKDLLQSPEEGYFGLKNINEINQNIIPMEY